MEIFPIGPGQATTEEVSLHCCGGFVVTQFYRVARVTIDIDFLGVVPGIWREMTEIGGRGSALHKKHKVYLDPVTIAGPRTAGATGVLRAAQQKCYL